LRILQWLAESGGWSLNIHEALLRHPEDKGSVGQIVQKHYLERLLYENVDLQKYLHYDARNGIISVEDPKFLFYLRHLDWRAFAGEIGFTRLEFPRRYDFALSFAGSDVEYAQALYDCLTEEFSCNVFLANESQEEIAGRPIEDVLGPVFEYDSELVIVLAGPEYPRRRWTQFEEGKFRARMADGDVIPIAFRQGGHQFAVDGKELGSLAFDRDRPLDGQVRAVSSNLYRKLQSTRADS